MAQVLLDFAKITVFDAASARRKLGALGYNEPTIDQVLHSLSLVMALGVTSGGTGLNTCAKGDLLVGNAPNSWTLLPAGTLKFGLVSQGLGQMPRWEYLGLDEIRGRLEKLEDRMVTTTNGQYVRLGGGEPVYA